MSYPRVLIHGAAAAVFVVILSAAACAQDRTIAVRNDGYSYRIVEREGSPMFVVDGFQPALDDADRLPRRFFDIPSIDGNSRMYTLSQPQFSQPFAASPHVYFEQLLSQDSVMTAVPRLRRESPAVRSGIQAQYPVWKDGRLYTRVVLSLLDYDPSSGETRWLQSAELTPTQQFTQGVAAAAEAGPYSAQPFIRRSRHLDTLGSWLDYSDRSVRFYVKTDGLFKLTKPWFAASGFPLAGVDPARLRLLRKGVEIPMLAVGMDDGSFDDADYFVFLGERNYEDPRYRRVPTPAEQDEPYPEYINKYTDSVAYWIVQSAQPAARIPTAATAGTPAGDTLDWCYALQRVERDDEFHCMHTQQTRIQTSDWTSEDTWHMAGSGYVRYGQTRTFTTTLDSLKPGIDGRFIAKLLAWFSAAPARPNFRMMAKVNAGEYIDSVEYNINEQALLVGTLKAKDMVPGTDTIRVLNRILYPGLDGPKVVAVIDWMEIEYPRILNATSNALLFSIDSALAGGVRNIRIGKMDATDLVLFKQTASGLTRIGAIDVNSGGKFITFADTLAPGARFALGSIASMPEPFAGRTSIVERLRESARQAKYIVLTSSSFVAAAKEYADFIAAQYATTSRVVTVEDIYDNYSFGTFNPEALKLFLFDAMKDWKTSAPEYVLLLGDANWNYKMRTSAWSTNFVPSYGIPAGDAWFVAFDSASTDQSMSIGRLPVSSEDEIRRYLEKHRAYLGMKPDIWNKTIVFFSGGDAANGLDGLLRLREANDVVVRNIVQPPPLAGRAFHFYKTVDPQTNFGPFENEFVKKTIDEGGIAISYIGHSGLDVWDNAIQEARQLHNARGLAPLVTDFGCSTGKFAEPDIVSFSEKFVLPADGQAIAYVGNSSLGFEATAVLLPTEFYGELIRQERKSIGEAHKIAKRNIIEKYGLATVNVIAMRSNALIGDPIVRIAFPQKPNLVARPEWLHPVEEIYTDAMDSLHFNVAFWNEGRWSGDTATLRIEDFAQSTPLHTAEYTFAVPRLSDTIRVGIPVRSISGTRRLRVSLDIHNQVEETSETDNTAESEYFVYSTQIRALNEPLGASAGSLARIAILNPMFDPGPVSQVLYEFDEDPLFASPISASGAYGKTLSQLAGLPQLGADGKHYWRASLPITQKTYAGPYAFWKGLGSAPFVQRDSLEFARAAIDAARYVDSLGMTVLPPRRKLAVVSAGLLDGSFGSVEVDDFNVLLNSYFQGYAVAVFDSLTLQLKRQQIFWVNNDAAQAAPLRDYLNAIVPGELAAVASAYDMSRNIAPAVDALRALGSASIDTLTSLGSFCMIGWRGAARGSIPEARTASGKGKAVASRILDITPDTAIVTSPLVGPAAQWRSVRLERSGRDSTSVQIAIIGVDTAGLESVLLTSANPDTLDITSIDAVRYPKIRMRASMLPRYGKNQPSLRSWSADYRLPAELAVNYQSVAIQPDTVIQGTPVELRVEVLNAGDADAGAFAVQVDIVGPDNVRRAVETVNVPSLKRDAWHEARVIIPTSTLSKEYQAIAVIDAGAAVAEQFEDNNVYTSRFYVRSDTTRPSIEVTLDGYTPVNGDVVSPRPRVVLTLRDRGPLLVTSCANFTVRLDDEPVSCDSMEFHAATPTSDAYVVLLPLLSPGEHIFHFNAEDASGNKASAEDLQLLVRVVTENGIRDVYTYPNPFQDATTFTFTLTGNTPPDAFTIKVYTVAGRLIRTIDSRDTDGRRGYPEGPRIGINVIAWDGLDEDGDRLANGVYFFKVITSSPAGSQEFIGRMAVLR